MYCAPASSVCFNCSPKILKSADSMDGAKIFFFI